MDLFHFGLQDLVSEKCDKFTENLTKPQEYHMTQSQIMVTLQSKEKCFFLWSPIFKKKIALNICPLGV